MVVQLIADLPRSYFWEHPAWRVKEAIEATKTKVQWVLRHDDKNGQTICRSVDGRRVFHVSDHLFRDADGARYARQAIAEYVQGTH